MIRLLKNTTYLFVFNANKSKWLLFEHIGRSFSNVDFHIGGNLMPPMNHESPHLGHIISDEYNDASDILNKNILCADRLIM